MAQPPKGGLVRGHDKPIHGSCAIYFPGGVVLRIYQDIRYIQTLPPEKVDRTLNGANLRTYSDVYTLASNPNTQCMVYLRSFG